MVFIEYLNDCFQGAYFLLAYLTEATTKDKTHLSSDSCSVEVCSDVPSDSIEQEDLETDEIEEDPLPRKSYEELRREYNEISRARDLVSAKLGQRMLEGYTLSSKYCTTEGCVGIPLMTKENDWICVNCDQRFTLNQDQEIVGNIRTEIFGLLPEEQAKSIVDLHGSLDIKSIPFLDDDGIPLPLSDVTGSSMLCVFVFFCPF